MPAKIKGMLSNILILYVTVFSVYSLLNIFYALLTLIFP